MIYLDYAANTPVLDEVLDEFNYATKKYIANPNSSHKLGVLAKTKIDEASTYLANYFKCNKEAIIYTSGSSESNNLVIKGIANIRKNLGNKIIISAVEHSSVIAPCNYLMENGFDVSVIPLNSDGRVNLKVLEDEIDDNTVLVSICSIDSELGTIQPIKEISEIVKKYPNCVFHTDATQAIGKIDIDYSCCDFITFAPHKFYGLNGFGCLINRNNNKLAPIIHGGKSTTIYRSGTPVTANVLALKKAFEIAVNKLDERYSYIKKISDYLKEVLSKIECIHINSPKGSIPNTINISLINKDTKRIVEELNKSDIYVSTKTACSLDDVPSLSVLAITNDRTLALNSIRISISHLTTKEEIDILISKLNELLS